MQHIMQFYIIYLRFGVGVLLNHQIYDFPITNTVITVPGSMLASGHFFVRYRPYKSLDTYAISPMEGYTSSKAVTRLSSVPSAA